MFLLDGGSASQEIAGAVVIPEAAVAVTFAVGWRANLPSFPTLTASLVTTATTTTLAVITVTSGDLTRGAFTDVSVSFTPSVDVSSAVYGDGIEIQLAASGVGQAHVDNFRVEYTRVPSTSPSQPQRIGTSTAAAAAAVLAQDEFSFEGSGSALFSFEKGATHNAVAFSFAAASDNAVILYNGPQTAAADGDFVLISLVDGQLRVSFRTSPTHVASVATAAQQSLADGLWRAVEVVRTEDELQLNVDGTTAASTPLPQGFDHSLDVDGALFIGGLPFTPSTPLPSTPPLSLYGCIADIVVDGIALDRVHDAFVRESGVSHICPGRD